MKLIIARKVETEVGVFGTRKWPIREAEKQIQLVILTGLAPSTARL